MRAWVFDLDGVVWTGDTPIANGVRAAQHVIANGDGMAERNVRRARAEQEQFDDYVRDVAGAGGAAAEIEKAKALLDSGAITQAEFDAIKAKALS